MKLVIFVTILALIGLVQPVYIPEEDESVQVPVEFPLECQACEAFAKLIGELVEKELPKDYVEKEAEKLCEKLGGSLKTFCLEHLVPVVDKIYDEIVKHTSAKGVCELLGFC
uniref:Prosaposin-like n=1 Tax=Diabrotica virgifera virgifera TaxID=50390 RepID=A0A6P7G5K4_DIAVI